MKFSKGFRSADQSEYIQIEMDLDEGRKFSQDLYQVLNRIDKGKYKRLRQIRKNIISILPKKTMKATKVQNVYKILGPWEESNDYGENWSRKNESGESVIHVLPEGLGEAMCWAWMIDHKLANNHDGSSNTKEESMAQADKAIKKLGYIIEKSNK
jgi:hypothetical protein